VADAPEVVVDARVVDGLVALAGGPAGDDPVADARAGVVVAVVAVAVVRIAAAVKDRQRRPKSRQTQKNRVSRFRGLSPRTCPTRCSA